MYNIRRNCGGENSFPAINEQRIKWGKNYDVVVQYKYTGCFKCFIDSWKIMISLLN